MEPYKDTKFTVGIAYIREVNAYYRKHNDSDLWPIRGRFSVTDRAIRQAAKIRREGGWDDSGYPELLDRLISEIVNDERNW